MQNNNDIKQHIFNKGLNLDLDMSLVSEDVLTHMRNGTLFTQEGNFLFAGNEQSNKLVCTLPYPIIGHIKLPDGKWALFLTDNENSEIGVFDEISFLYTTSLNAVWLNFNKSNIITGASKELANGEFVLTFADGRRNPDRRINLSKVTTATEEGTRLAILTKPPFLNIRQSNAGILPNGSYQAIIRYSINQTGFGSYYSLTLPTSIWSDMNNTGALEVDISSIDGDFDYFELVVIQTTKNVTTAKLIGTFPRATSKVHISSFDREEYIKVDLAEITTQNQPWISSDQISSNNQYLFRVGVETIPELNYQLQAFNIKSEYVVWQTDEKYHSYGDNVGMYRDEVGAYSIQWLHRTGAYSSAFHVAGRTSTSSDMAIAGGTDVWEALVEQCDEPIKKKKWQVYNTAQDMIPITSKETICEGKEIGYGKMGYWESSDNYPDNKFQFGKWANTPIRHHKFPDEEKAPRFSIVNGEAKINILGVRFSNIPHPLLENGELDLDWIGYRIIRVNRDGNKSVISRMMLTNVASYQEMQGNTQKEVLFTNFPINDLRPNSYISQSQTAYKNGKEQNFVPLSKYYKDKFTAYSPHFNYDRYSLGEEIKIETEEIAEVTGQFTEVYNHPKHKLLSLFSFWLAAMLGAIEALLVTSGKVNFKTKSEIKLTALDGGSVHDFEEEVRIQNVEDLVGVNPIALIAGAVKAGSGLSAVNLIRQVLLGIASAGLKVLTFTFWAIQYADQVLDVIYKFLGYTNYALQYNCHAFFNNQTRVEVGNKRRHVTKYQYLQPGQQTINNKIYNNFRKHNSVYVELSSEVGDFKNVDNSRQTMSDFRITDIGQVTTSQAVAFYATSKRNIPNQYGRIESNINFVLTHNNYFESIPENKYTTYQTPAIFGGDCYIVRDSVQTKHLFFTQDQSYPFPSKDGEEYNYLLYRNIGYPRFWANFFKYDFSELITKNIVNFSKFSRTVASRHNLDNKGKDNTNKFRVDNAYFYTSCNGVLDYFVESDFNLNFREKSDNDTYHYSDKFSSLPEIFRSDRLLKQEQFKYDKSLSKQANQIYVQQQPIDYNPATYNSRYKYSKNRILYSLPSYQEFKFDNWQYFLTGNQYEFPKSEFGNLTSLHRVDGDRILFLFDRSSPYITLGQNQLQTKDGTEIELGSGGLFAAPPRAILYTEQMYGNCQSRFGSISTQFGTYFPSERQGRLFKFSGSLDEITRNGIQKWSSLYFPVKLLNYFPDYKDFDNPIAGVGYLTSFDSNNETIYISKKDYIPNPEKDIVYDKEKNIFTSKDVPVLLSDTTFFTNISFTISFSPTLNSFISFHDWQPDWVIPTEKFFITSKGNKLYQHNNNPQSYCNYYGVQYPWEVGYIISNKFRVEILASLEYYLECYKYKADGINKVHILNENFDKLIIKNSEQISGLLTIHSESGNPYADSVYPIPNKVGADILFSKVENKYRIDQFFDITKDRQSEVHLLHHLPDGWKKQINPGAINPFKSGFELKSFRHYDSEVWFAKENPKDVKMILKLTLGKETVSPR